MAIVTWTMITASVLRTGREYTGLLGLSVHNSRLRGFRVLGFGGSFRVVVGFQGSRVLGFINGL